MVKTSTKDPVNLFVAELPEVWRSKLQAANGWHTAELRFRTRRVKFTHGSTVNNPLIGSGHMSEGEVTEVLAELVGNSWDRIDEESPNLEVQLLLWSTEGVEMFRDEARMGAHPEESEEGFEKEVRRMKLGILEEMWKLCTSTLGELRIQSAHSSQQQRDTMQVAYDLAGAKAEDRQAQYDAQVFMASEHEKTERARAFLDKLPLIARLVNSARAKAGGPTVNRSTGDGDTDGNSGTPTREPWVDEALADIRGGADLDTLITKYGAYFADTERFDAALATLTPEEADLIAAATGAPPRG